MNASDALAHWFGNRIDIKRMKVLLPEEYDASCREAMEADLPQVMAHASKPKKAKAHPPPCWRKIGDCVDDAGIWVVFGHSSVMHVGPLLVYKRDGTTQQVNVLQLVPCHEIDESIPPGFFFGRLK